MDWLNEAPAYSVLAPQLMWIKILEICAVILFALVLLTLLVVWLQHLSWRMHLCALLTLGTSIAMGMTAHGLHDNYVYWVYYLGHLPPRFPSAFQNYFLNGINNANQTAVVLGWVFVLLTGVLLVLSIFAWWRLTVPGRRGRLPASLTRAPSSGT